MARQATRILFGDENLIATHNVGGLLVPVTLPDETNPIENHCFNKAARPPYSLRLIETALD
jgi:hypothetical protein